MEEMTASEILRRNADDNWSAGVAGIAMALDTVECNGRVFELLANKIDAELAQARKEAVNESKKPMWWFRSAIEHGEDWPEPRDGEKFRDYLHRCFIPRPRFEDGEPVQFEDDTVELHGVEKFIFLLSCGGSCQMQDADGNICNVFHGERVKRPAPEVLGADGKPIKAGETVYRTDAPITEAMVVDFRKYDDGSIDVVCSEKGGKVTAFYSPSLLTHTPPDTQERIDEDAKKGFGEYWGCRENICAKCGVRRYDADSCGHAMRLDLLRRQRELDARKGGAE